MRSSYRPIAILTLLLWMDELAAKDLIKTVEETKALYTRSIAEYTTWPNAASAQSSRGFGEQDSTPFVIGVVGLDPNGVIGIIQRSVAGASPMKIKDRNVKLVQIRWVETTPPSAIAASLDECNLLFFSQDSEAQWRRLKPLLRNRPIMTVSEFSGFAEQGGIVEYRFDKSAQRIYMIFNMQALRQTGVAVSARLLDLKISRLLNPVVAP